MVLFIVRRITLGKKHIFKIHNKYCMFDGDNIEAYMFSKNISEKLNDLSKEELTKIENSLEVKSYEIKKLKINAKLCHRLTINMTSKCNLACRYCYANKGDYGQTVEMHISEQTVLNTIQAVTQIFPQGIEFIQFFGGEPLLNKELMFKVVPIINLVFKEKKLPLPKYVIVTNGTLVDDECIDFFVKYFESVTISLDGCKEINDYNRFYSLNSNESVYDKICETIKRIKEKDKNFNICCEGTINKAHICDYKKNKDVGNFYSVMKKGFDYFQASPVFGYNDDDVNLQNVDEKDILEYFDKLICKSIYKENGKIKKYIPSKDLYEILRDRIDVGNGCGANESDIAVDVGGNLYPCFMFIGDSDFFIGNVNNFDLNNCLSKRNIILQNMAKANKNEKCNSCWAEKLCSLSYAHCIGSKKIVNGDISKPIDLNCKISKKVLERLIFELIQLMEIKKEK